MTKTTTKRGATRARKADAKPAAVAHPNRKPKIEAADADQAAVDPARGPTKLDTLIGLLRRPEGATISDMMVVTNWQAHSVRGAIAGALKKQRGLNVVSEVGEQGRTYRIPAEAAA